MRKFYVTYILGCTCQDKVIHDKEVWLGSDETACSKVFKRYLFGNPNANHTIIAWSLIEE